MVEGEAVGNFSLQDLCFPLLFNISGMTKVDRLITSWRDETVGPARLGSAQAEVQH